MPITEQDYSKYKEYWDYQRKIQYNRERVLEMAKSVEGRVHHKDIGFLEEGEIYQMMWNNIKPEYYDDPPEDWIPEDKTYQLWNEVVKKRKVKKQDD